MTPCICHYGWNFLILDFKAVPQFGEQKFNVDNTNFEQY